MRKNQFIKIWTVGIRTAFLFLAMACIGRINMSTVRAEESGLSADMGGTQESFWQDVYSGNEGSEELSLENDGASDGAAWDSSSPGLEDEAETEAAPGTYTMEDGWTEDELRSTDDVTVYVRDAYAGEDTSETSLISCSYLETNYSRQEYEQLRDMLTNNLLYSNVNAQITTSAVYTLAMDYLYIVLVDDSSEEYRDVYHYVVGDYQCFCVQVTEYRDEAEQDEAQEVDTPREIGQKVAEGFVWN